MTGADQGRSLVEMLDELITNGLPGRSDWDAVYNDRNPFYDGTGIMLRWVSSDGMRDELINVDDISELIDGLGLGRQVVFGLDEEFKEHPIPAAFWRIKPWEIRRGLPAMVVDLGTEWRVYEPQLVSVETKAVRGRPRKVRHDPEALAADLQKADEEVAKRNLALEKVRIDKGATRQELRDTRKRTRQK